jgi:hypothetical protein
MNSALLIILSSTLTFMSTMFFTIRSRSVAEKEKMLAEKEKIAEGHAALQQRVAGLESQLALVNQAVVPISTAFQAILIKELTHYHTKEMDALLVKVGPPNVLTGAEESRLAVMLEARTKDMGPLISASERDAAMMLPAVMTRAKEEQLVLASAEQMKLKLVTVAAVIGITETTRQKGSNHDGQSEPADPTDPRPGA